MSNEQSRNAPPVLVVSPHLDDAVLSAWGIISRPSGVTVVNVFCAPPDVVQHTEWDRKCGFADSHTAVATRRLEDERALARVDAEVRYLDLVEGQYLTGPRSAADAEAILNAISSWKEDVGGGVVALPAGAGWTGHNLWARLSRIRWILPAIAPNPDHVYLRDLILPALSHDEVWLYEELPYRWGRPGHNAASRVSQAIGHRERMLERPVDRTAKAAAIGEYRSQISWLRGRRWMPNIDDPRGSPRRERYWVLDRT